MESLRVLVVEDNAMNRSLLRTILRYRGHEVREAATIPEAREALTGSVPDVVLLDVQVPGGGGETLLRELRAAPATRDVPVVAVTALAMAGDRERLLKAGFDDYVSKPIEVREFASRIEAFVGARRGDRADRPA